MVAFVCLAKAMAMSKPTTTTNALDVAHNYVRIYCDADTIVFSLVLPSPDTFSLHPFICGIRHKDAALSNLPFTTL